MITKGKNIGVIGAGISGLVAAAFLARAGHHVQVFEKNGHVGGRIQTLQQDGYCFDMGPSWYWMPDVMEYYFSLFGYASSDFYELVRLDPSYRVFWQDEDPLQVPASISSLYAWFEKREPGSAARLQHFLLEAGEKYEKGMWDLARRPMSRMRDLLDPRLIRAGMKMSLLRSMDAHLRRYFKDEKIRELLGFPVLFLGGTARQIPALYSLMTYADLKLGTWYPVGGMTRLAQAWRHIAEQQGVTIHLDSEVSSLKVGGGRVRELITGDGGHPVDGVIAAADYQHVEQRLLPAAHRRYSASYWNSRTLAPSSLLFYMGLDCKVPGLAHHNLFFDRDLDEHARAIYHEPAWPREPLFYLNVPSRTDASVAPQGRENLTALIPVAPDLSEDNGTRDRYFRRLLERLEHHLGFDLSPHVVLQRTYGMTDFSRQFNAYKGNAYGLANTLAQTAILKPSMAHRSLANLKYAGHMTTPGPGIPPSMISGQMAAGLLEENLG